MIQLVSHTKKYKNVLKNMWKQCFPLDSERFVDFYFDRICQKDETLIFVEKSELVASMQILPYSLKVGNRICRGGYISGLMTLPNYRKRGYMSQLLNLSFDIMQKKGYEYTFLIPQEEGLIHIYKRFGYRVIQNLPFHCPECDSYQTDLSCRIYSSFHMVGEESYSIYFHYSQFLKQQPYAVLKTAERFQHILWTFFYDNGNLFAREDGIAFTSEQKGKILVKEFFYKNEIIKKRILQAMCRYYGQDIIVFSMPSTVMIKELNPSAQFISHLYVNMMMD